MPTMPGDAGLDRSLAFLRELIDTPADVGPGYLKGRLARWRAERWAGRLVDDVRRGQCAAPAGRVQAAELDYSVPEQDLRVRLDDVPALPPSGFVITGVRARAEREAG